MHQKANVYFRTMQATFYPKQIEKKNNKKQLGDVYLFI